MTPGDHPEQVDTALVKIWGHLVGAVSWDPDRELGTFEYAPEFLDLGLDLAPLTMPLSGPGKGAGRFNFPALPRETFKGLPGLLADALPDDYGNSLIDAWLARQGRSPGSFSPVERLCYTGRRAVGALEFEPAVSGPFNEAVPVEIAELVNLAQSVSEQREGLTTDLNEDAAEALMDIIRVGTSAGGGRPKAVVAYNPTTGEMRSGQVDAPEGFQHWLLKFDGVSDRQLGQPAGYGRIEYAYHLMALACDIEMQDCRLLEENGRAHFMTRRFDRPDNEGRLHLQSLCAMAHFDFNDPSRWSYEQAFQVMRELRLPYPDMDQQYRRMVFNIVARNQDDHTKNIAYLMDPSGRWRLSPAYDLTFAYNPSGMWTHRHQMSVAGKREGFTRTDLLETANAMGIKKAGRVLDEIQDAVSRWPVHAAEAGLDFDRIEAIKGQLRLNLPA